MNLQRYKKVLNKHIENYVLHLSAAAIKQEDWGQFTDFFAAILTTYGDLKVAGNSSEAVVVNGSLTFEGTLLSTNKLYPTGTSHAKLVIEPYQAFGNMRLKASLTITISGQYHFYDTFPDLQEAYPALYINQLIFENTAFIFDSSIAKQNDQYPIRFQGDLQALGPISMLAWMFNGQTPQLTGLFTIQSEWLPITLGDGLVASFGEVSNQWGYLNLDQLDFKGRLTSFWDEHYNSSFELITTLKIGAIDLPVAMPLIGRDSGVLTFYLDTGIGKPKLSKAEEGDIEIFSGFLGNADGNVLSQFKTSNFTLGSLSLDQLNLSFSPRTRKFSNIQLGIGLGKVSENGQSQLVDLFDGKLTIERLNALLTVGNPQLIKDTTTFDLDGFFIVGNSIKLRASITFPSFDFEMYLREPITIQQLLNNFIADDNLTDQLEHRIVRATQIDRLAISGSPKEGTYTLVTSTSSAGIQIVPNFKVQKLAFMITRKSNKSVDISFEGQFSLAEVPIYVQLAYKDKQWDVQGSTGRGVQIHIDQMITELAQKFGINNKSIPATLANTSFSDLSLSYNSGTKQFTFSGQMQLPLGEKTLQVILDIELEKHDQKYDKHLKGFVQVGHHYFTLLFNQQEGNTALAAIYKSDEPNLNIKELIVPMAPDLAPLIPESLHLDIKDVFFGYDKVTADQSDEQQNQQPFSGFVIGADLGFGMSLSGLPLVGKMFPADMNLGIDNLQLVVASTNFTEEHLEPISNALAEGEIDHLPTKSMPEDASSQNPSGEGVALPKGLNLAAQLSLGTYQKTIILSTAPSKKDKTVAKAGQQQDSGQQQDDGGQQSGGSGKAPKSNYGAVWLPIQKAIGPVHVDRLGFSYKKGLLKFYIDGGLKFGPLKLDLIGLNMGTPLKEFDPHFGLMGIGVDFKNKAIELAGELLKAQNVADNIDFEYDGYLLLNFKKLSISALGSYAKLKDGETSLFVYLTVDYPIGGAPWFFVTGLSGGFGYNREIITPPLKQLDQFPLIQDALGGKTKSTSGNKAQDGAVIKEKLEALKTYIPPASGEYFLAAGIKFTSFEILNALALLTFSFGERVKLELFGRAFLVQPPIPADLVLKGGEGAESMGNFTYLAKVEIDVDVTMDFDKGILQVFAGIKEGSFVYSPLCTISGSMVFKSWFKGEHAGDFVLVVGGYHKDYKVPKHYPSRDFIDLVTLQFKVNDNLYAKGSLYFALTPACMMAGGEFEAVFHSAIIDASLRIYAHFFISWKPFHYDILIGIEIKIGHITGNDVANQRVTFVLGAELHIWGPDFSGTVKVTLGFISKTITFGSGDKTPPPPITWEEFSDSFLPKKKNILSLSCTKGLLKKLKTADQQDPTKEMDTWLFDNKNLSIGLNTVIPMSQASLFTGGNVAFEQVFGESGVMTKPQRLEASSLQLCQKVGNIGIKTMHLEVGKVYADLYIQILREGETIAADDFIFTPIYQDVPSAMWGDFTKDAEGTSRDRVNQKSLVKGVITGMEVTPGHPPKAGKTHAVPKENLQYNTSIVEQAYFWEEEQRYQPQTMPADQRKTTIIQALTNQDIEKVYEAFRGINDDIEGASLVSMEAFDDLDISALDEEMEAFVDVPQVGIL